MSRQSPFRFVPSVETFEGRVNLSPVATYHLEAAWPSKVAGPAADYSAIAFVGGWGSSSNGVVDGPNVVYVGGSRR